MSTNLMGIFPADPRQPKPSWPRLRNGLLERGFILEPRGADIPHQTLWDLWYGIMKDRGAQGHFSSDDMDSLAGVLAGLKNLDLVSKSFALDCGYLDAPTFIDALKEQNYLSSGFALEGGERFVPGPLYSVFSDAVDGGGAHWTTDISFDDHGDDIKVMCGRTCSIRPRYRARIASSRIGWI